MTAQATLPDVWELDDKCGACGLMLSDHRINTLQCPDPRGCGFASGVYTEPIELDHN